VTATLPFFQRETCSYRDVIPPNADHLWVQLGETDRRLVKKIAVADTGCWLWIGAADARYGYGYLTRNKVTQYAHRWVYELLIGPIPDGLFLDHLCRRPPCVCPLHLEPVTAAVNTQRAWAARPPRTHCGEGHELERRPSGALFCRVCRNREARDWYRKNKSRSGKFSTAVLSQDGAS
jgi:hypothetical protein